MAFSANSGSLYECSEISLGSQIYTESSTLNTIDSINTLSTIGSTDGSFTSSFDELLKTNKMEFNVDGEKIEFKGRELLRLREMLTEWINENHPEDAL